MHICKNEAIFLLLILKLLAKRTTDMMLWNGGIDSADNWYEKTGSVWNVDKPENTGNFLGGKSNQRGSNETYAWGKRNNSNHVFLTLNWNL